jgi:uncharacterized protein with ParB-like and HNH nuclease domain
MNAEKIKDIDIEDETEDNDILTSVRYDITSYGADFDVLGIVDRMKREDIVIPDFQRNFVWRIEQSSRFIESLLLGLPVPGIFLAQEQDTRKLLVIDGQQRLKTLKFFYQGIFNPPQEINVNHQSQIFMLSKDVVEKYRGCRYVDLHESNRRSLDNATIHATIVKQNSPEDDDTSIYHIYERLNSGGRFLTPQEIRSAVYHGKFIEFIKELNMYPNWRSIFGKKNDRLKDQELILRFFGLYFELEHYREPLFEFINVFTKNHRKPDDIFINESKTVFTKAIDAFYDALKERAFRKQNSVAFNAAIFDSMMYGLAHRMKNGDLPESKFIKETYYHLLEEQTYYSTINQATAGKSKVLTRLNIAKLAFSRA